MLFTDSENRRINVTKVYVRSKSFFNVEDGVRAPVWNAWYGKIVGRGYNERPRCLVVTDYAELYCYVSLSLPLLI